MSFISANLDFILTALFVAAVFAVGNLLPLMQKWRPKNLIFCILFILFLVSSWLGVNATESYVRKTQKEKLLGYAPSYAWVLEQMNHEEMNQNTKNDDPNYLKFIEYQKGWLNANPFIADIYSLKKDEKGKVYILVDSETDYNRNGLIDEDRESRTLIGENFEKDILELQEAFDGKKAFTHDAYSDRWGTWVSAFVPLRSKNGQVDAVLALDFPEELYISEIRKARYATLICFSLFYLLITSYLSTFFQQRRYNLSLKQALYEAKKAAAVKSEFLANMSHEIRTPLNAILGMISLLSLERLDEEAKRKLSIMKVCSDGLLTIINDTLDFSKIEAGKLKIEFIDFTIHRAVSEIVELMHSVNENKDIAVKFVSDSAGNLWISSDLNRLRQVLMNLMANALKFTSQGEVLVKLSLIEKGTEDIEVVIRVCDTGIGVPIEDQAKLFQSFSQVDASTTRRFGGTGLGLAISKGIMEAMGGRIWLESSSDQGSTFSLSFTAKRVFQPSVVQLEKTSYEIDSEMGRKKPLKILVADDQMPNRLLAVKFLKLLGYEADAVCSGCEVLYAYQSVFYDVVFMDCQMPQMDGFVASTRLKRRFSSGKKPWIIALTAGVFGEDRKRCFAAGMDAFMAKPFSIRDLVEALETVGRESKAEVIFTEPVAVEMVEKESAFDAGLIRRHFRGDEEIMISVVNDFLATYPKFLEELETQYKSKNYEALRLICHRMRGNVGHFFNKSLEQDLLKIELAAKNDPNDLTANKLSQLAEDFNDLGSHLEKLISGRAA